MAEVLPDEPEAVRSFESALTLSLLDSVQSGVFRSVYRGVPFQKSPFDIALYLQLFSHQPPRTVIEIGTKFGGSALWFADTLTAHGCSDARVISVDIDPVSTVVDARIMFLKGDAKRLGEALPDSLLSSLPRPFLVIEDASHLYEDSLAVLEFFHPWLTQGEHLVVEDGVIAHFSDGRYSKLKDGPNRAVRQFLAAFPGCYEVDVDLCDHFGRNVTYNPNGWLRRL